MSQDNKKRGAEENPNQARTTYYINIIFLCALTLVSLIFSLIVYFRLRTAGSDGIRKMYTEKQIGNIREAAAETGKKELLLQIQTALESGRSTTSMLQEVFEDSIVVVRDGRYYFYPAAAGVEKSALEPGSLRNGGDRVVYTGDLPGIEVSCGVLLSEENGKVDWGRLSESDVEETAVLAGTVTAKGFFTDAQFARNCRKAVEKGMKVRLCVDLMEPADGEALAEAAQAVRDAFEEYGIRKSTLDIFADGADADAQEDSNANADAQEDADANAGAQKDANAGAQKDAGADSDADSYEQEDAGDSGGGLEPAVIVRLAAPDHGDAVSESGDSLGEAADAAAADETRLRREWTESARLLCEGIEDAGGVPVLGADLYAFAAQVDMEELGKYGRWLTDHADSPGLPYSFSFWEYSSEGALEGVPGVSVLYARISRRR